jgi:hypothetical protein
MLTRKLAPTHSPSQCGQGLQAQVKSKQNSCSQVTKDLDQGLTCLRLPSMAKGSTSCRLSRAQEPARSLLRPLSASVLRVSPRQTKTPLTSQALGLTSLRSRSIRLGTTSCLASRAQCAGLSPTLPAASQSALLQVKGTKTRLGQGHTAFLQTSGTTKVVMLGNLDLIPLQCLICKSSQGRRSPIDRANRA